MRKLGFVVSAVTLIMIIACGTSETSRESTTAPIIASDASAKEVVTTPTPNP